MSGHTPGPWEVVDESREPVVMAGDYFVATVHGGLPVEQVGATARLIAAAPDLLEALRDIINDGTVSMSPNKRRAARALIAKVEGR